MIGNDGRQPKGNKTNMPVTNDQKHAMLQWVIKGLDKGYLIGPFTNDEIPYNDLIYSPFGAVTQETKIRPIINMSSPKTSNLSVNDTILEQYKSVNYVSLREIVKLFYSLGTGAYIWSADAKDAYLIVPIAFKDRKYMGFKFGGFTLICTTLMFGLSSACNIYTKFADAIQYICVSTNPTIFRYKLTNDTTLSLIHHYLDDFFGGHNSKDIATAQMQHFIDTCFELGVPLKYSKLNWPSQIMKLLGWIHNTATQSIHIPNEKIEKINKLLNEFIDAYDAKTPVTFKKYQSLYGLLRWAFTAIFGAESLLLSLHYTMYKQQIYKQTYKLRITKLLYMDLKIIKLVINSILNGISYKWILNLSPFKHTIYVDASLTGLGGYMSNGQYFHYNYHPKLCKQISERNKPDIQWLEMAAIVCAVELFEPSLRNNNVLIYTDNQPVEYNIKRWHITTNRIDKLYLLKILSSRIIINNIQFKIHGIRTNDNIGADLLSRHIPNKNDTINSFKTYLKNNDIIPNDKPINCFKLMKTYLKLFKKSQNECPNYNSYFNRHFSEFKIFKK